MEGTARAKASMCLVLTVRPGLGGAPIRFVDNTSGVPKKVRITPGFLA